MTSGTANRWAWTRRPRLAVALLLIILAGGTAGYIFIERWSFWDAFYMTVTTVATVGFLEGHPLSFAGQVFTVALIFLGVGTAFYTVTLLATIIVEGGLHQRFERRRVTRMMDKIKDHFNVCRLGRNGGIITAEIN